MNNSKDISQKRTVNRRSDNQKGMRRKFKGPSISEIEKKAREKRMSYGEYVALYN